MHKLEQEWGVDALSVLDALYHSKGFIRRGMRGIIAECEFARRVLIPLAPDWTFEPGNGNDASDFILRRGDQNIRVQVKMQRTEDDKPLVGTDGHAVVECQKSNGRGESRAYHYGDFEVLAVSLWPSTKNWDDFIFSALHQLPHKPRRPRTVKTMQSVPLMGNTVWTRNFADCLQRAATKQALRETVKQLELV